MNATERYQLDLRGYAVIPGVLSGAHVERLTNALLGVKARHEPGPELFTQRINGLLARDPAFVELLDHPTAIDALDVLIGRRVRVDHVYAIRMAPFTTGLTTHGAATPFDPGQYYLWNGRIHCGLVSLTWALTDHPADGGGFGCIPGSHKANFEYPGDKALALMEEVPMAAGDLLVFTEALTHCTLPWQGPGERRILLYKYSPGHSAWAPASDFDSVRGGPGLTKAQSVLLQAPSQSHFTPLSLADNGSPDHG